MRFSRSSALDDAPTDATGADVPAYVEEAPTVVQELPTPGPGTGQETCPACGQPVPPDGQLLQETLADVAAAVPPDQIPVIFYGHLFRDHPEVRTIFPDDMTAQNERLLGSILALFQRFGDLDSGEGSGLDFLRTHAVAIGRAHARFNLGLIHYVWVEDALLATLREAIGQGLTPVRLAAVRRAYTFLAGVMASSAAVANHPAQPRRGSTV